MARRPGKRAASWQEVPTGSLLVVDSAPIIYLLEDHPMFAPRYEGLFEAEATGELRIVISTITIAEVLSGPFIKGQDALAARYAKALASFDVIAVSADIAIAAARLRTRYRLKLPDAIQLATALDCGAHALVTHDRDFSRVEGLRIIGHE